MAQNQRRTSVIDFLGEEIVRIIAPVSICMFLVVLLVSVLDTSSNSFSALISSVATIAYNETSSDSFWDKLVGALLNSLAFVAVVTVATFVLVLLFYLRCTRFLKLYMGFSSFVVLGFLGGEIALLFIEDFSIPVDCMTFFLALFNFAVAGALAVFMSKMAIVVTQGYLILIGMLVAYWFTMLPEWTTWVLLVALALYDLAAVLLPFGPLRLLVELAVSRDEEIPALVYEARPVNYDNEDSRGYLTQSQRRVRRDRGLENSNPSVNSVLDETQNNESNFNIDTGNAINRDLISNASDAIHEDANLVGEDAVSNSNPSSSIYNGRNLVEAEEGRVLETESGLSTPLIDHEMNTQLHRHEDSVASQSLMPEGIGLGSSGAIKLGLGDFIFYSVLVGRAAMYDYMAVYSCYLAIIAGLGITLMLLALYQKALPALPVSIMLGLSFYFLTRQSSYLSFILFLSVILATLSFCGMHLCPPDH
ncbi:presenilin-like protein At2g29900 [Prosopis cineraria]|uniref:presenilin-like protein At2g29900 n=1 Tax=Prosopis cineraria TaxID=364024 RepID=UPI00240F3045|nr:presenilin-like protein At2g29900 [Prosopis cineraria]